MKELIVSAKAGKRFIIKDGMQVTYPSNMQSGTNFKPSGRPPMRIDPWQQVPPHITKDFRKRAINKLVGSLGMNPKYADTFQNPFTT